MRVTRTLPFAGSGALRSPKRATKANARSERSAIWACRWAWAGRDDVDDERRRIRVYFVGRFLARKGMTSLWRRSSGICDARLTSRFLL